jgi:hypothetical protein
MRVCGIFLDAGSHKHLPVGCVPRETESMGWNSSFLVNPLNWVLTAAMFLGGFLWEFRRARSK